MMTLYLTCLIVGGIFIVVSLFFDTDTDSDVDLDTDVDFDAGSGADVVNGEGAAAAIKFLSFRNFVMFTAFFGLTGTVLTWLGGPFLINLAAAIALGLFAATLMHKAMSHLMKNEVGKTTNLEELIGSSAKVTIDVSRKHRGKISVFANGRTLQLLAQVAEEAAQNEFKQGDTVIIINIQNGMAFVVEEEFV
jgi:membrane protein implicated in regulation of membrane protease activity